jgi:hypothetical protein
MASLACSALTGAPTPVAAAPPPTPAAGPAVRAVRPAPDPADVTFVPAASAVGAVAASAEGSTIADPSAAVTLSPDRTPPDATGPPGPAPSSAWMIGKAASVTAHSVPKT